jgi:hypothetical protein
VHTSEIAITLLRASQTSTDTTGAMEHMIGIFVRQEMFTAISVHWLAVHSIATPEFMDANSIFLHITCALAMIGVLPMIYQSSDQKDDSYCLLSDSYSMLPKHLIHARSIGFSI